MSDILPATQFKIYGPIEPTYPFFNLVKNQLMQLRADSKALWGSPATILTRNLQLPGGIVVKLGWVGDQSFVVYHVPSMEGEEVRKEEPEVKDCFCNCCWAEGQIKDSSNVNQAKFGEGGKYGSWGIGDEGATGLSTKDTAAGTFPLFDARTVDGITEFKGIRYLVEVCQLPSIYGNLFICTSSDYAEYAIGDKVIVGFHGNWIEGGKFKDGLCFDCVQCRDGCWSSRRTRSSDDTGIDGNFIIYPIRLIDINPDLMPSDK